MDACNESSQYLAFSDTLPPAFSQFRPIHGIILPDYPFSNQFNRLSPTQLNCSAYDTFSLFKDPSLSALLPNNATFQSHVGNPDLQSMSSQFSALINANTSFSTDLNVVSDSKKAQSKQKTKRVSNVSKEPQPSQSLCGARKWTEEEELSLACSYSLDTDNTPSSLKEASVSSRKYFTYSQNQKRAILNYFEEHGFDETIEKFGEQDPNLTLKKIKSWQTNIDKVKNIKGKQSNDPIRNQALVNWYNQFKQEHGKLPNSRELRDKALELSNDSEFIASKGWLDKFRKKFKIELQPLKVKGSNKKNDATNQQDDTPKASLLPLEELNMQEESVEQDELSMTHDIFSRNFTPVPKASFDLSEDYRCSTEIDSFLTPKCVPNQTLSFEIDEDHGFFPQNCFEERIYY